MGGNGREQRKPEATWCGLANLPREPVRHTTPLASTWPEDSRMPNETRPGGREDMELTVRGQCRAAHTEAGRGDVSAGRRTRAARAANMEGRARRGASAGRCGEPGAAGANQRRSEHGMVGRRMYEAAAVAHQSSSGSGSSEASTTMAASARYCRVRAQPQSAYAAGVGRTVGSM